MTDFPLLPDEIRLGCAFIADAQHRSHVLTLWTLLETLRDIPRKVTEPLLGQMRYEWWRESLEALEAAKSPNSPLLAALKDVVSRNHIGLNELAAMPVSQSFLCDGPLDIASALTIIDGGEGTVMRLAAKIISPLEDPRALHTVARAYGLCRLRPTDFGPTEYAHALSDAAEALKGLSPALLSIALPVVSAQDYSGGKSSGPLSLRWRLFKTAITGRY